MNSKNKKESNIDKKYRELLFQYSLGEIAEATNTRVVKYEFLCPFCSTQRKDNKKHSKCSALFWLEKRGCFMFQCFNNETNECQYPMVFSKFLERLNSSLFRNYQKEQLNSFKTGERC